MLSKQAGQRTEE